MNTDLFRKASLARLASPEQLDELLAVTNPKGWFALLGLFLLLGAAVVWGYTGSLPTKATGQGLIVRTGGVLNVVSNGSGTLIALNANVGDHIKKNEIIARVAQPEQLEKIKMARAQLEEAQVERDRAVSVRQQGAGLEVAAITRQEANIQRQIAELNDQSKIVAERIPVVEQLLAKGLVTRQSVLDAKQRLVSIDDQIANLRTQLTQLDSQKYTAQAAPLQSESEMKARIADLQRNLAAMEKELEITSEVVSPYEGDVIELKVYLGSAISAGMPLLSVQLARKDLQLLVYLPASQAKDAKPGMKVQISPSTVKREEYGFMEGKVLFVSDYPATPAALMRNFENEAVVSSLTAQGLVTEVQVEMLADSSTRSGYKWSSRQGPPIAITSGTICTAEIITREQRPISLLFPYVRAKLGFS